VPRKAFANNYAVPTPADLTFAVSDMETAYTNVAGLPRAVNSMKLNYRNCQEGQEGQEDSAIGIGVNYQLGGTYSGDDNTYSGASSKLMAGVYTFDGHVTFAANIDFDDDTTDKFIIQMSGSPEQYSQM
jgi:hypothetical protein